MYKDKETARIKAAERQRKHRLGVTEGVTQQGVTKGVTDVESVPASYIKGLSDFYESLPERPRYLPLSDGQVLDRLNQPQGHGSEDTIRRIELCNDACYTFKPSVSIKKVIDIIA